MNDSVEKYRDHLVDARHKAQEDYDKTVLSLSGGALGISFAFIKDIIGDDPVVYVPMLVWAWGSWAVSSGLVLISYFTSVFALKTAIKQVDEGEIYSKRPGGLPTIITNIMNFLSGSSFLAGLILIIIFVSKNM